MTSPALHCPFCDRPMTRNGTTNGHQRWRCRACGHGLTNGPNTHGGYRHGQQGRTGADRVRDCRERQQSGNGEPSSTL